jgi:hypothetical protein
MFAVLQYFKNGQQSVTQFEDDIEKEYRSIAKDIPIQTLLGESISEDDRLEFMNAFYNYIDFTNGQIQLCKNKRIRPKTWESWVEGIEENLKLPAFKAAWEEIKEKLPNSFNELRKLEQEKFKSNPAKW